MLNNILNFDGVSQLNKTQQASIKGGETCRVIIDNGANGNGYFEVSNTSGGQAACDSAGLIYGQSYERCQYDCKADGFTASWWPQQ